MNNIDIILNELNILLENNVLGDIAYGNRCKGFIGELDFLNWMSVNHPANQIYTGGYFIPKENLQTSLKDTVYVTISKDNPGDYLEIYQLISLLSCQKLFYVHWNSDIQISQWQKNDVMKLGIPLLIPIYKVYEYSRENNLFVEVSLNIFLNLYEDKVRYKKVLPLGVKASYTEKLKQFNESDLLDLYVQRLFFDGFVGVGKVHGKLSDIDLIVRSVNPRTFNQLYFFEIKEKNPSKGQNSGFGMDLPRIEDLNYLQNTLERKVVYIVRHIDNQQDRRLVNWKYISISNFSQNCIQKVIEGGIGMRSHKSSNPTYVCPIEHFKVLE